MSDVSVRPALPQDVQAITDLQVGSIQELTAFAHAQVDTAAMRPQIRSGWEQTLTQPAPEGCFTLVALHGNRVVGVVCAVPGPKLDVPAGPIPAGTDLIAWTVDANFRRVGHASRMFAAAVRMAKGKTLRAWAGVDDDAATRFLQACGFGPSGLRQTLDVGGHSVAQHLWFAKL